MCTEHIFFLELDNVVFQTRSKKREMHIRLLYNTQSISVAKNDQFYSTRLICYNVIVAFSKQVTSFHLTQASIMYFKYNNLDFKRIMFIE